MNEFRIQVVGMLDNGGVKGYNTALRSICKALPHALGEIIYKVVRYHAKHDLRDLVKIAAWAELEWESANVNRTRSNSGDSPGEIGPWTVPKGHDAELRAFVRGDWGGGPSGGRDHAPAPAKRAAAYALTKSARGTGAVRGGDKHVGGKHRRRNGKGKS